MIKIGRFAGPSPEQWEIIIEGMRNAMNSWDKSDSYKTHIEDVQTLETADYQFFLGENDETLMKKLRDAGTDHRKFMRTIVMYVNITAPLYWWKEFDTYKVGTVANSCSTMHKIHSKEFTLDDFSCEHLIDSVPDDAFDVFDFPNHEVPYGLTVWGDDDTGYLAVTCRENVREGTSYTDTLLVTQKNTLDMFIIPSLNANRAAYLKTKDKKYWWQMIQLLPSSYNQKRTVLLNYEVLANIYRARKNHKLDEWRELCKWIESLPYSWLITGDILEETDNG